MSIKVWENDFIGVIDAPTEEIWPYRDSIFVNNQNSLQFGIRLLSAPPESYPNSKPITCFTSDLEQWGFEDDYRQSEYERKERLKEWLSDCLLVFKVERRIRYNHEEVFNAKDVRLLPKLSSFTEDLKLIPMPIFSKQTHGIDVGEFAHRLLQRKFVGRIDTISHEAADTPPMIVWREEDGHTDELTLFGEFEGHQYAHGGFSFDVRGELKECSFRDEWLEECYFCSDVDEVVYVPLSIYEQMVEAMEQSSPLSLSHSAEPAPMNEEVFKQAEKPLEAVRKSEAEVATTLEVVHSVTKGEDKNNEEELSFLEQLYTYTQDAGLSYRREDVINFHTCMKSSPLVILSGMSGTGKSKLVDLYSYSLGVKSDQFTVIPVNPSWTSDSDLIGYADTMNMVYRPGDSGLINALKKAADYPEKLFVICFDEMNLARVEHYFSQFLSILEREQGKRILRLYNDDLESRLYNSAQYPPTISIQDNVLFVGTVNVDESTYHFSDKVLDRANVLALEVMPFSTLKQLPEKKKTVAGRKEEVDVETYRRFKHDTRTLSLTDDEIALLWDVHEALQQTTRQLGVGPRIVKQIDRYVNNLPIQAFVTRERGFDLQFVQRVLTKIRGSEEQLRRLLGTYRDGEVVNSQLLTILDEYEHVSSFEKSRQVIEQKVKELKFNGYTF
ncbi:AAA family ATPase [Bacillus sp. CGMCC 1.16541]|uniref:McrB family protein n=1 Tax=Bacillus sp. CGMCC 1.16541 TaxID=2185143 RepID=UPI000D73BDB3|nr:AAA family ATPase [Bacillus sp. CGMCC 1.16541]